MGKTFLPMRKGIVRLYYRGCLTEPPVMPTDSGPPKKFTVPLQTMLEDVNKNVYNGNN